MSYIILHHKHQPDELTSISYDPDTKQTEVTFTQVSHREFKWTKLFYIIPIPTYSYSDVREVVYVFKGKKDIPTTITEDHSLVTSENYPSLLSIVYRCKNNIEIKPSVFWYIIPFLNKERKEEKVVTYRIDHSETK